MEQQRVARGVVEDLHRQRVLEQVAHALQLRGHEQLAEEARRTRVAVVLREVAEPGEEHEFAQIEVGRKVLVLRDELLLHHQLLCRLRHIRHCASAVSATNHSYSHIFCRARMKSSSGLTLIRKKALNVDLSAVSPTAYSSTLSCFEQSKCASLRRARS